MIAKYVGLVGLILLLRCAENEEPSEQFYPTKLNWGFDYSGLSKETLDTLLYFEDCEVIPGQRASVDGHTPQAYHTRINFVKSMSLDEANKLYHHPNPTIKGLAIEGLFYQKDPEFGKKFIQSYSKNDKPISKRSGCLEYDFSEFEYFLEVCWGPKRIYYDTIRFTKNDTRVLDSLLMITDSAWTATSKEELGISP